MIRMPIVTLSPCATPISTANGAPHTNTQSESTCARTASSTRLQLLEKIRDWVVSLTVIVWGGTGIYDRFCPPEKAPNEPVHKVDLGKEIESKPKKEKPEQISNLQNRF